MTPRFEDALDVTPLDDGRNWRVVEAFYYDTDVELTPDGLNAYRYLSVLTQFHCANGHDFTRPASLHSPGKCPYCGTLAYWNARRITVPAGFVTDFASIPRLLWRLLPPTGRYTRASVVHDLLYRTPGLCTRAQADAVLYEAMKYPCKVGFFTRWTIWLGVRVGGWAAFK